MYNKNLDSHSFKTLAKTNNICGWQPVDTLACDYPAMFYKPGEYVPKNYQSGCGETYESGQAYTSGKPPVKKEPENPKDERQKVLKPKCVFNTDLAEYYSSDYYGDKVADKWRVCKDIHKQYFYMANNPHPNEKVNKCDEETARKTGTCKDKNGNYYYMVKDPHRTYPIDENYALSDYYSAYYVSP